MLQVASYQGWSSKNTVSQNQQYFVSFSARTLI